jgi:hypothetical protein
MNFPILQPQEPHRSRVFPDVDHPSKALSNVFPEKRQDGMFAGLHMPAGRFVLAITSGRNPVDAGTGGRSRRPAGPGRPVRPGLNTTGRTEDNYDERRAARRAADAG